MQQKDITIINIVRHLQDKLGVDNLVIKDHWGADNCAIGLTNKDNRNLVYISAYMKRNNEYFVALESPSENENDVYQYCGVFENLSIDKVEELVRAHLNLK